MSHPTATDRRRPGSDPLPADELPYGQRALVLGGGGSAGNAWVIGVVAGLADAGINVAGADLIIGTSAGSTAAAQISGADPAQLYADILSAPPRPHTGAIAPGNVAPGAVAPGAVAPGGTGARPAIDHLQRTNLIIAAATDPADMRRRLGAAALELAAADDTRQAQWRATVASRLPSLHWPPAAMLVTAVDARTGEPVMFDRHSGVELADAVAASTSSGPAYAIGGSAYIDGGYRRSSENADLAAGSERVLVLSPLGGRTRAPVDWGMQLAVQVEELRAGGSGVETILPDPASLDAFGDNMMDLSRRTPAARAGYEQALARAGELARFWG